MSSAERRPLAEALAQTEPLLAALGYGKSISRWMRCGSIRRQLATVGDIEIVCTPQIVNGENRLLPNLDALRDAGTLDLTIPDPKKGTREARWGEKYREFIFRTWKFDLFITDEDNFWLMVVIRTGNDVFSRRLMSCIKAKGQYRIGDGYIRPYFEKRGDFPDDPKRGLTDKYIRELPIVRAESEEFVLSLAGKDFEIPPQRRSWVDQ